MLKDFSNVVCIFLSEKEDLSFILIVLCVLGPLFIFLSISNQLIFLSLLINKEYIHRNKDSALIRISIPRIKNKLR